ncbi:MAG: winged helix family transcriptional regulator [Acidobacteria bacterium]|nr:MAG: winged helix family transcriptional regulator [Acidobacteriota bacterium]
MHLDPSRRKVIVRGQNVSCSKQEFDLLYVLAASPGIVFSREELVTRYWPGGGGKDVRLVDPIVSRLRRKIERQPDSPQMILTVWGIGYKFAE